MSWEVVDRPGYFGKDRNKIHEEYDGLFGENNWRIAWQWGNKIIQKPEAFQIYEDGYYEFFKENREILKWLVGNASDVYDTAPSNINSEFDYNIQETRGNHIHDIAIRRAVLRNGLWFNGNELIHVRPGGLGEGLGPYLIAFHKPEMIYKGKTKYKNEERDFSANPPWWLTMGIENSIEQFYQQNKVLEVMV